MSEEQSLGRKWRSREAAEELVREFEGQRLAPEAVLCRARVIDRNAAPVSEAVSFGGGWRGAEE
jgi:hypothetical protein